MAATGKMGLIFLLLLPVLVIEAQNEVANNTENANVTDVTVLKSNTTTSTPTPQVENLDFILQLSFKLVEPLFPSLVINKSLDNVIDRNEVLQVYISKIKYLNLQNTINLITLLNCEPSSIFNIDNFGLVLEYLNISFNKLYETVNKEFKFLTTLLTTAGIDVPNFSVAFISDETQAWPIFKKGNFSKQNIESALSSVNRTLDELYEFVKLQFINEEKTLTYDQIMNISGNCVFQPEKYINLWTLLNVTKEDALKRESISLLLSNFENSLSNLKLWGVVVDTKRVALNTAVLDYVERIMFATRQMTTLNNSHSVNIEQRLPGEGNIVFFNYKSDHKLATISYDLADKNLSNCFYFTNNNGSVKKLTVSSPIIGQNTINVTATISQEDFILGSPLSCGGMAYGLASSFNFANITFDKFPRAPTISTASSSASSLSFTTSPSTINIYQSSKAYTLTTSLVFLVVCFLSKIF